MVKPTATKRGPGTIKPRKGKVLPVALALILDESGSMGGLAVETRGGLNDYLSELGKDSPDIPCFITKFATKAKTAVSDTKIKDLTGYFNLETYVPSGWTALYDAIGKTIHDMDKLQDTHRMLFVVMTDGQENASKEFNQTQIKQLISEREAKGNWTFVYLAANQDAWVGGQSIGISSKGNTQRFVATAGGQADNIRGMTTNSARYIRSGVDASPEFNIAPNEDN